MSRMIKYLSGLTLMVLMLCLVSIPSRAEDNTAITFSMEDESASYMVGDMINIQVWLSNNPGSLSQIVVSVSYDADVLQYEGISYDRSICSAWNVKLWDAAKRQIRLSTNSKSLYTSENGLLCTLSFRALAATDGTRVTPNSISMSSSTRSMTGYRYGIGSVLIPIEEYHEVTIPVTGLELNKDSLMLVEGQTAALTAVVMPDNATSKTVSWSSANEAVATVDRNGTVTARGEGQAVITASAGGVSARVLVTVQSETPPEEYGYIVDLSADKYDLAPGQEALVSVLVDVGSEDQDSLRYYNAIDTTIAYDVDKLTYLGLADNAAAYTVTEDRSSGTIRFQRFGSKLALGNGLTMRFQAAANAKGTAEVFFVNAYIDKDANAVMEDAPPATMRTRIARVQIGSPDVTWRVSLPAGYEAGNATVASPSKDYVFSMTKDSHYDYTVKAAIGSASLTLSDTQGTGHYVIPASRINGDIVISVEKTPRVYSVEVTGTGASDVTLQSGSQAVYGQDFTFLLAKMNGYSYSTMITSGSGRLTGINPTVNANVYQYTIPGRDLQGPVVINVAKTQQIDGGSGSGSSGGSSSGSGGSSGGSSSGSGGSSSGSGSSGGSSSGSGGSSGGSSSGSGGSSSGSGSSGGTYGTGGSTYSGSSGGSSGSASGTTTTPTLSGTLNMVSFEGSAKDLIDGPTTISPGEDYTFRLKTDDPSLYRVSAKIDGKDAEVIDNEDGTYTVKEVNGILSIFAEEISAAAPVLEASAYVKLDGKDMYLITASGDPGTGHIFTYNTKPMYYSDKYGAWCYLVISAGDEKQVLEEAAKAVAVGEGTMTSITYDGEVNISGRIDINDAQLVYGMYNARYDDFSTEASILKFLKADMSVEETSSRKLDVSDAAVIMSMIR